LRIVDVSNPLSPHEVGHCLTAGYASDLDGNTTYVYVAACDSGLRVLHFSGSPIPYEVGSCILPGVAYGVEVRDSYAFVGDGDSGLRVVNVSNPAAPHEVGHCDLDGSSGGVALSGNYAYVTSGNGGIHVVDVSNPLAPHEAGFHDVPSWACNVAADSNYAYLADWEAGLQVYEFYGGAAVEETMNDERGATKRCPTIVRGVVWLVPTTSYKPQAASLLDISGRKVLGLKPGANDVRHLSPGVYFVRAEPQAASHEPQTVSKVVVTR
jgi:hypothetical protein